jgi:hypothetical protein
MLAATAALPACGPVEYLSQVSGRAATALAQAEREEADHRARYEYVMASEYYRKAREEAGESSYQIAVEYGRRSEEMANKARALAREKAAAERTPPGATPVPGEPAR